jgi:rhamnogalacturonan endolyase
LTNHSQKNYYHFNHFPASTPLHTLYKDATRYRPPAAFLEAAAEHVPNYHPPSQRSSFTASIKLPSRAKKSTIILSVSGFDVQDNTEKPHAYQYWATLDDQGKARIKDIVPGTYRITIYADDVFGQFIQDNVVISPPPAATTYFTTTWTEESAGLELWRLGTPDHSAGEFRHGYTRDTTHRYGLQEYRIFYGAYTFNADFPSGVHYRIGRSKPERDWNYVQWAAGNSNTWYVEWKLEDSTVIQTWKKATFTLQAAGIRTAAGNEHYKTTDEVGKFAGMDIDVTVNGKRVGIWSAPLTVSGSCAVRSGVVCYNSAHKFVFDASVLKAGENVLGISLPKGASGGLGNAKLAKGLYAQWDALRLEVI